MYDTVCNIPLTSDLFALAIHPREPILAAGLASGHVQTFILPSPSESDDNDDGDEDDTQSTTSSLKSGTSNAGINTRITPGWRTRRHKGSTRALTFSLDGQTLFSTGTDGLIKAANTGTGQVFAKLALPSAATSLAVRDPLSKKTVSATEIDAASLVHVLSPQTFLVATDSSALYLYDLRANDGSFGSGLSSDDDGKGGNTGCRPAQTHYPHNDYISSLTPLPPSETSTSGYSKQWVTTGGTTLSVTDLRRGVLVRSEDQEEELLSSTFVTGLQSAKSGSTSRGAKCVVGGAGGVLTLWERGVWDDQDERIVIGSGTGSGNGTGIGTGTGQGKGHGESEGESIDVLAMLPPSARDGAGQRTLAAGLGNGVVAFVELGINKVVGSVNHDSPVDGVVGLGFDVQGRMITGGGSVIKVWHEQVDADQGAYVGSSSSDNGSDSDAESDADSDSDQRGGAANGARAGDQSSDDEMSGRATKRKKTQTSQFPGGKHFSFAGLD